MMPTFQKLRLDPRAAACLVALATALGLGGGAPAPEARDLAPLVRTVDLDVGGVERVRLHDGTVAEVEVRAVEATMDAVMDAVRAVHVTVRVNGETKTLQAGNYQLPVSVGGVQIDCPVTSDYMKRTNTDWWGLEKAVRLRLWPAGSPYSWPGTFVYPVSQKWLATLTQYSNEPVLGSPRPDGQIYYHAGIDLGGAEDLVEIYAATDGVVVSARGEVLPGEPTGTAGPISERYDVVYLRDARGWYYRYSHLDSIDPSVQLGRRVRAGHKLGMLGKEGGSGGWTHLHFHIMSRQPSGRWGIQDAYAFLWEAYLRQYDPDVVANARPHHVIHVGETATLSAANAWAKHGVRRYDWTLSDGSTHRGKEVERTYDRPGMYSEIVKVTDAQGNYDYDFATVLVFARGGDSPIQPPRIHATYYPTMDIKVGDKVSFLVRSQGATAGYDVWDFGDGSDPVQVKSDIDTGDHAKVGYATTTHRFAQPGDYLVSVQRESPEGTATDRLYVKVHGQ